MSEINKLWGHFYEVKVAGEAHAQFLPIKRDELISVFIRKRYSLDDELAILANGNDTEKHASEYAEYQSYRKAIKDGIAEIAEDIASANAMWESEQPKQEMSVK